MSKKELELVDVEKIVQSAVKNGQLSELIQALDKEASVKHPPKYRAPNQQQRKDVWRAPVAEIEKKKISSVKSAMRNYMNNYFTKKVEMVEPRELTQDEVNQLAAEYREVQEINDLLQSRKEDMKELVFTSLTEKYESESEFVDSDTPPTHIKGRLTSPEYGLAFCREGGDRKKPTVDFEKLKEKVSDTLFQSMCTQKVIPEHIEYTLDEDKMMDAVQNGSLTLETIREVLIPGSFQSPRFTVREI